MTDILKETSKKINKEINTENAVIATAEKKTAPTLYEYRIEELHCRYGDADIFGTLYIPCGSEKNYPTVICSHGFNSIGADMGDIAAALAESGVMAYTFDYCGGSTRSSSSGNSVDMSIATEQNDLLHIIDMISAIESADSSRLYLCGESQGGFVAALTAAEMPHRIAGMFLIYPAFCIPDQWLAMDPEKMTEPFNFMGDMRLSRAYYDGVPRYDVYEHIRAYKNPVFIYHGDKDQVVDISYARRIDKELPNSVLAVIEGGGHGFGEKDRTFVRGDICGYFSKLNRT